MIILSNKQIIGLMELLLPFLSPDMLMFPPKSLQQRNSAQPLQVMLHPSFAAGSGKLARMHAFTAHWGVACIASKCWVCQIMAFSLSGTPTHFFLISNAPWQLPMLGTLLNSQHKQIHKLFKLVRSGATDVVALWHPQ